MRCFIALVLYMVYMSTTVAVEDQAPTAQELRMLPYFCKLKFGGENNGQLGISIWGQQFANVHHYCTGLNWMNRYYKRVAQPDAARTLHAAIVEFNYMVEHLYEDGSLAGEIMMNRGLAYMQARQYREALQDLYKALQYNPQMPKVYRTIARYYEDNGQHDKAIDILDKGIGDIPSSNSLQRMRNQYIRLAHINKQ